MRILRGDREGALPYLERAVELGVEDPAVLIELGRAYRLQGRAQDAIRLLAPVVAQIDEPAARRELTRAQLDAGNYQTALAESTVLLDALDLSAVRAHDLPELMDIYEVAAEAARGTGDSIRAAVLYSTLQSVVLRYNRRDLAEQVRRLELRHTEEFVAQRARLAEAAVLAPQHQIEDLLTECRQHLESGLVFAALDASYAALDLDSMRLRPFIDIAAAYIAADQPVAATALLRSVEEVARLRGGSGELAPAQRLLGRVSGDLALREQAIAGWLAQGEAAEAGAELAALAEEAERAGEWRRAEALLRRLLSLEPDRAAATLALARVLYGDSRQQEALATLFEADGQWEAERPRDEVLALWATAVTQLPEMAEVRQAYGERLLRRGRPAEGVQELIWAADIASRQGKENSVASLLRVAQVYDEMDDLAAALHAYDRLMRQVPGNAQAQEHFVAFCLRRGRPDLAARTLRTLTAFLLDRQDAGSPTGAVAALTQLMVLRPDDSWAYEQLAAILTQEGRQQEALMVYRQLAARRPQDQDVAERVRALSRTIGSSAQGPTAGG